MFFLFFISASGSLFSQAEKDSVNAFATFGNMIASEEIEDAHSQTVFFAIPGNLRDSFFLRVFDPDCGGLYDKPVGLWETNTIFEVYGGIGCISEHDARKPFPEGNYKSGMVLHRAIFAHESEVDGQWVPFGPFSTDSGEELEEYPGYVFFKLIVEGRTGNDGNVYALSISSSPDRNGEIENAEVFAYRKVHYDGNELLVTLPALQNKPDKTYDPGVSSSVAIPVSLNPLEKEMELNIVAEPLDQ